MGCPFNAISPANGVGLGFTYRAQTNPDSANRYENTEQTYTAECNPPFSGTPVSVTIPAGEYVSYQSQEIADAQALAKAMEEAIGGLNCLPPTEWMKVVDQSPTLGVYWAGSPFPSSSYTVQNQDGFSINYSTGSSLTRVVSTNGRMQSPAPDGYDFLEIDFDYVSDTNLLLVSGGEALIKELSAGGGHENIIIGAGITLDARFKTGASVSSAIFSVTNFRYRYRGN